MRSPRKTSIPLLALAALLTLLAVPAAASAGPVGVYDSLAVLRPEVAPPSGAASEATIEAAGNETQSFQLSIRPSSGLAGVDVDAGTLSGPGGATIPAEDVTVYREGTYQVAQRSDGEGSSGAWPDVLIPQRDTLYGETRNAFPIDVAAGTQLGVWVDVFVPADQRPGVYTGQVAVSSAAGQVATVPVKLSVADFTLSATSNFKSAFHVDPWQICKAFTGEYSCTSQTEWWRLDQVFAELGLNNRVTISNPYPTGYNAAPSSTSQKENFAKYIVPLLNGTDPRVKLQGAELTSFDAYWQCVTESTTCLGDWKALAEKYGFAERFFLYNCDEPGSAAAWSKCAQTAATAEGRWSGVHKLITAPADELQKNSAASYTTIDTPVVNDLNSGSTDRRSEYNSYLQSDSENELWIYNSCMSFSCNETESPIWNGWPGYAIDEPASQAEAMGWMGFAYQASGELYYEATQSLTTATTNQYYSGGNGDGNLFYAGTPNGGNGSLAIGGTHSIPLETIRLKRIRDGYQDNEYLRLASQAKGRTAAMSVVEGLYGNLNKAMNSTTVSGSQLDAAREQLSAMIAPPVAEEPAPPTEEPKPPAEETEPPAEESTPPAEAPTPAPVAPAAESAAAVATAAAPAVSTAPAPLVPKVKVLDLKVPKSTAALVREGAKVLVSCSSRCRIRATTSVTKALARKLGLSAAQLGEAGTILSGSRWIVVRPSGAAAAKLTAGSPTTDSLRLRAQVSAEAA